MCTHIRLWTNALQNLSKPNFENYTKKYTLPKNNPRNRLIPGEKTLDLKDDERQCEV